MFDFENVKKLGRGAYGDSVLIGSSQIMLDKFHSWLPVLGDWVGIGREPDDITTPSSQMNGCFVDVCFEWNVMIGADAGTVQMARYFEHGHVIRYFELTGGDRTARAFWYEPNDGVFNAAHFEARVWAAIRDEWEL